MAKRNKTIIPKVALVMKPVDGGRAVIGILECPNCGETHYTTQVSTGVRDVFCGSAKHGNEKAVRPDGYSTIDVQVIV